MSECACCGQTLPPVDPPGVKLTPRERRIYEIIQRAGKHGISADLVFDRVYADDRDGGPNTQLKIISVFVCSLNRKLPKAGQMIKSGDWGGNHTNCARYWLVKLDA